MEPLDLTVQRPRRVRETMLGFYFIPRTIDKLRAELPGGNLGSYMNHDRGLSAYVVRRLGLDMNAFRDAVAAAHEEGAVEKWLAERIDLSLAPDINAKFESFVASRMSADDRVLLYERHPILQQKPDLTKLLDILDADDDAT